MFRDCIFFPSWGAIFNVPESILKDEYDIFNVKDLVNLMPNLQY